MTKASKYYSCIADVCVCARRQRRAASGSLLKKDAAVIYVLRRDRSNMQERRAPVICLSPTSGGRSAFGSFSVVRIQYGHSGRLAAAYF